MTQANTQVVLIKLTDITPSPYQPRVHFDEEKLSELASSIKEKGVLQPITVRAVTGKATPFELVMGERRWRACAKAERVDVPALVRELTDDEAQEIALVENLQRDDLTPMEEARSIQQLVVVHGGNKSEAARKLSKNEPYVYAKLALLTLPREVQNMIEARIINEAAAKVILEIENPEKQLAAAKLAQKLNLSAVHLRARVQQHISKEPRAKGKKETSGERKPTSFKQLSSSLVNTYEALEGYDCEELEGDEKGLKAREMLRKQCSLVRQSLARIETALLRDPPKAKPKEEGKGKPPKLTASAA